MSADFSNYSYTSRRIDPGGREQSSDCNGEEEEASFLAPFSVRQMSTTMNVAVVVA